MPELVLLNKPFGVICQFRDKAGKQTLKTLFDEPGFYPAGRLDENSEGLVLLTNDGKLQARIAEPKYKLAKTYWVEVEGEPTTLALAQLAGGVLLKDGLTRPAIVQPMPTVPLPARNPPVRFRANIPTCWISITLTEGRNRQVRRMTAGVGYPTLRLYRYSVGTWTTDKLKPGEYRKLNVNLPR